MGLFQEFADVADRHPEKNSLVTANTRVSYAELKRRAEALASQLDAVGVAPGDRVALLLSNGVPFVQAALAIWKLGAIVVPLHVKFQEQEILRYLADCEVTVLVANHELVSLVQSLRSKHTILAEAIFSPSGDDPWRFEGFSSEPPARSHHRSMMEADVDWPALTQYSTGSTGLSKRITRTHGQVFMEFKSVSEAMKLSKEDRILGVAPFFHSYGFMNCMICSILSGATLFPMSEFFNKDVARLISAEKITGFPGVPFMYQLLLESREPTDFSSLRYALSAGAPLPEKTGKSFFEKFGLPVRQLYGSTETGVISINRGSGAAASIASVGFPIAGVAVDILDDDHRKVHVEMDGNIAVRSAFAARSYDGDAAKSESQFINDYFLPGDLGWINDEGRIVITGRKRMFINVGGNKVDPTEVENVLREHPALEDVAVVGVPDGKGGESVKAVLVSSSPCTRIAIMEHCRGRIAEFKHPRIIEFREEIMKSPLGKVLRKYLVEPTEQPQIQHAFSVTSGFRRVVGAEPELPAVDFNLVPPLLRVLSVTDGTVTKTLEAFFWEPIEVECLQQSQAPGEDDVPQIELRTGDMLIRRQVILRGVISRNVYAFAETLMRSDGLGSEFTDRLVGGQIGIGELLRDRRLESYREVSSVERLAADQWAEYLSVAPTDMVVARKYRIFHKQRPAILIMEVFPEQRFETGQSANSTTLMKAI